MSQRTLDLDLLRSLVVAHDLGGLGQAAERLGRTPSAVSLQMKRLQEDLGAVLFRKQGRGLALTETGELVLQRARELLALNDALIGSVRGAALSGAVRLGAPQDIAETVLPDALSAFAARYPRTRVELRIDGSRVLADEMQSGELDLALTIGQPGASPAERVAELPLCWIARAGWTLPADQPLPLVLLGPRCVFRRAALQALEREGHAWRLAASSPSVAGARAAVSAGLGLTVRTRLGLPQDLVAGEELFGLPRLPSLPLDLRLRDDADEAATRLRDMLADALRPALAPALAPPHRTRAPLR